MEMNGESTQTTTKASGMPEYTEKWRNNYASLPAVFNPLPSSTNQEAFEKQLYNESNQYVKYRNFSVMKRKPSCATTESTFFAASKDEWNTKEATGKSVKNALYILWYAKRHLLGQSDIEQWKIKCIALATVELHWSEGIREAVS